MYNNQIKDNLLVSIVGTEPKVLARIDLAVEGDKPLRWGPPNLDFQLIPVRLGKFSADGAWEDMGVLQWHLKHGLNVEEEPRKKYAADELPVGTVVRRVAAVPVAAVKVNTYTDGESMWALTGNEDRHRTSELQFLRTGTYVVLDEKNEAQNGPLTVRDADGDKWNRNEDGTYTMDGEPIGPYYNRPLSWVASRFGPLETEDGKEL